MRATSWSWTARSAGNVLLVPALVLVLGLVAGCSHPGQPVQLSVSATETRMDEPVTVEVTHLDPGSTVDLTLGSTDAGGTTWTSRATFVADAAGTVDPNRAAPSGGSYLGTWGMGLFSSMSPTTPESGYRWPTSGPAAFELGVRQGDRVLATASLTRTMWTQPPTTRTFSVAADGFVGTYVRPAGAVRGPAVLVLGGSEGGDPVFSASVLAARGIPALSVAYFRAPGLPSALKDIPLEYFDAPLRWLRRQPEVDPARVWISGGSRGSEAAALVAAGRPGLVHGLLDLSPSATANCAYVPGGHTPCPGPAWLRDGRPVPYAGLAGATATGQESRSAIPVERIDGPVLTLCGGADLLWSSCAYADAIQQRLQAHHTRFPHLALSYPDAGHAIDLPMPFEPMAPPAAAALPTYGSTPTANDQARADAWGKVLAFVRQPA